MINKLKQYISFGIKNSGSLFVLKLIGIFFNYLVLMLIIHYYSFEVNGEYANFIALSRAIKIFIVFGLDYLIVKEINQLDQTKRNNLIFHLSILSVNIFIFVILFLVFSFLFEIDYYLLFGSIFLALWRFLSHFFRGKNNMIMYGFFEFVLLQLTVLIALLVNHFVLETNDLIQSIIFVNIIALLLIIIFFIKKIVQEILSINLFNLIKEIYNSIILVYKRAIHFVLTNSISIISTTILYTIIKSEYSLEALGIYDTILRFSQIVTLPLIATNGRVMTIAAKFYNQKNLKELKTYVVKITRMLMLVSSLVFAGVIVFYYLYSELYNNLLSDYWALFILLIIAQLINNWAGPVGVILQVTGNEKTFNKITLISAFYLITSTIILTKYFSITILGLNTLIYLLILNLQSLKVLKNRLNINPHSITKKNELPRTET